LFDLPHGLDGANRVLERAGVVARCTRVAAASSMACPKAATSTC
jgi:hypothetical protein